MNFREESREIAAEFKVRYSDLTAKLGRNPSFAEEIPLSQWYKDAHSQLIARRELDAKMETQVANGDGCRTCGGPIERTGKRGRPPVNCLNCRGGK